MLSGGERARVELCKLMLKNASLLLLDEPTNHLDIPAMEALEDALSRYQGTMLVVSHDRYFINKLAGRIAVLASCGMEHTLGNYDDYLAQKERQEQKTEAAQEKKHVQNAYKLQKERDAAVRALKGRISRLERDIGGKEAEAGELERQLEDPAVASDYLRIQEIANALQICKNDIEALLREWEKAGIELQEYE